MNARNTPAHLVRTLAVLALAGLLAACANQQDRDALDAFLTADTEDEAMRHVADDFALLVVRSDGSARALDRDQLADAAGWRTATNTRYTYKDLWFEGKKAQGVFSESSDFYRLLDSEGWTARLTFRFDDAHKITSIDYEPLSDQARVGAAMSEAVAWARQNRPDELAAIYPNDEIVRSGEAARRWIELLHAWRADTGRPPVEIDG